MSMYFKTFQMQFEDHIAELESKLSQYEHEGCQMVRPHTSMSALEKELDSVRERYKKRISELETEQQLLQKQLQQEKGKSAGNFCFTVFMRVALLLRLH